jgi:hypothetical protein
MLEPAAGNAVASDVCSAPDHLASRGGLVSREGSELRCRAKGKASRSGPSPALTASGASGGSSEPDRAALEGAVRREEDLGAVPFPRGAAEEALGGRTPAMS